MLPVKKYNKKQNAHTKNNNNALKKKKRKKTNKNKNKINTLTEQQHRKNTLNTKMHYSTNVQKKNTLELFFIIIQQRKKHLKYVYM